MFRDNERFNLLSAFLEIYNSSELFRSISLPANVLPKSLTVFHVAEKKKAPKLPKSVCTSGIILNSNSLFIVTVARRAARKHEQANQTINSH